MSDKKKCLIVDDSSVIRAITVRIIADLGLDALEADTAVAAIEICRQEKPSVVLLDWDLPSMGALDFLRGAGEFDASERPDIILCATENDPQQFTLAKAAGAAHYILKPFDRFIIEAKLGELGFVETKLANIAAAQAAKP